MEESEWESESQRIHCKVELLKQSSSLFGQSAEKFQEAIAYLKRAISIVKLMLSMVALAFILSVAGNLYKNTILESVAGGLLLCSIPVLVWSLIVGWKHRKPMRRGYELEKLARSKAEEGGFNFEVQWFSQ